MPKWNIRIRRICTDYDHATIEVEAPTAEAAKEVVEDGDIGDFLMDDVEFGKEEIIDTEYEIDESYEITQVNE